MNRNGSIMIFVLLTFMLIATGGLLAIYMSSEQIDIANNSITKIQSQYLAESKINKVFYDEKYYQDQLLPSIMNHRENEYPNYTLETSDIFLPDNNSVNGRYYNLNGKRYLELSTQSDFQGTKSKIKAYGTVFNDLFYDNNPALSYNNINEEHLDRFTIFMNEISNEINLETLPTNMKGMNFYDYQNVIMKNDGVSNYNIFTKYFYDDEVEVKYKRLNNTDRIFMVVKNPPSRQRAKLYIDDYVVFRGILYVEGDLIINSDFWFIGILIVNGNIIIKENLATKPRIEGVLLYDKYLDLKDWNLKYVIDYVNRFGIYLPNFIEPKLQVYKFMEGS